MIPETNRILLILRQWEVDGLTLTIEGDKIRTSRPLADDEREFIVAKRQLILEVLPSMSYLTKEQCFPALRESYHQDVHGAGERIKERRSDHVKADMLGL